MISINRLEFKGSTYVSYLISHNKINRTKQRAAGRAVWILDVYGPGRAGLEFQRAGPDPVKI